MSRGVAGKGQSYRGHIRITGDGKVSAGKLKAIQDELSDFLSRTEGVDAKVSTGK